jgi:hypothetical protein
MSHLAGIYFAMERSMLVIDKGQFLTFTQIQFITKHLTDNPKG